MGEGTLTLPYHAIVLHCLIVCLFTFHAFYLVHTILTFKAFHIIYTSVAFHTVDTFFYFHTFKCIYHCSHAKQCFLWHFSLFTCFSLIMLYTFLMHFTFLMCFMHLQCFNTLNSPLFMYWGQTADHCSCVVFVVWVCGSKGFVCFDMLD